jgi:phosphoribosylanthranilate isomerase
MTRIKICGITSLEDAAQALSLGADALGFNFFPGSPRYVSPEDARKIVSALPRNAWMTGVFVDAVADDVRRIAQDIGLDTLQFHGGETVEFCRAWPRWRVLKALSRREELKRETLEKYAATVNFLLIDSASGGGSGTEVSSDALQQVQTALGFDRVFLAGGLNPENVRQKIIDYRPFAVDVASGVESAPGKKSAELMRRFIDEVRNADKCGNSG